MKRREFLRSALAVSAGAAGVSLSGTASRAAAQAAPSPLNPDGVRVAGIKMVPVCDGKYKVWTKKVGSGPIKVLMLHGGPGYTHDYLEAMESFLPQAGIEMYYYDQLGAGNSDTPDDSSLWTLDRFTTEVEEVRRGLDLNDFVLYGHGFGGMLAIEYALKNQKQLRGMVVSNSSAGVLSYLKRLEGLRTRYLTLDEGKQLDELELAKDYDNPIYVQMTKQIIYHKAFCRMAPWPEPLTRSLRLENKKIYDQMLGKSAFDVTGNLKNWERWNRLHQITVKTLVMGSEFGEVAPADTVKMANLMPNATSAMCSNGSQMSMWDDQAAYFDHLLGFLRTV